MLLKEAFHIYGSFFEINKEEEVFRDILSHFSNEIKFVIMTHPVILERFSVLHNIHVMFQRSGITLNENFYLVMRMRMN